MLSLQKYCSHTLRSILRRFMGSFRFAPLVSRDSLNSPPLTSGLAKVPLTFMGNSNTAYHYSMTEESCLDQPSHRVITAWVVIHVHCHTGLTVSLIQHSDHEAAGFACLNCSVKINVGFALNIQCETCIQPTLNVLSCDLLCLVVWCCTLNVSAKSWQPVSSE